MIICGHSLSPELRVTLRDRLPGFQIEQHPAPAILDQSVCFPDLPLTTIADLLSYGIPLQVWTSPFTTTEAGLDRPFDSRSGIASEWSSGRPSDVRSDSRLDAPMRKEQLRAFYEHGIAAVHFIGTSVIDPLTTVRRRQGRALLFIEDRVRLNLFRQIFLFAGMRVRSDLRSSDEFARILPEVRASANDAPRQGQDDIKAENNADARSDVGADDMHVVIDLDRGDFLPALHALSAEREQTGRTLRLWALRDFSRPGPDPVLMQRTLSPFTTRIFEPLEAALALIEALFLYDPALERFQTHVGPLQRFDGFRSIDQILTGRTFGLLDRNPEQLLQSLSGLMEHLRLSLPFHWLYTLYELEKATGGLLLADPEKPYA